MRGKEEAHDYRYFPDPDLLPLTLAPEWIDEIGATLPELPGERRKRLITTFHLSRQEAAALVGREGMADFFEAAVALGAPPKAACNWLLGDVLKSLNRRGETIRQAPITPEALAELIELVEEETISGKQGKEVLERIFEGEGMPRSIVAAEGMAQISDTTELTRIIEGVIAAHPKAVADYRAGNAKILGFFVGQVMKATKGKANPKRVDELLKRLLKA
ncbi:MAG: hypothetical protein D6795_19420 [Deltaproteobacteria bacterium]|nr:MAG: hypothetical protein D6795_19420 [Deltaproteobacteria bacterium]